jgi:hypothetical protein
LLRRILKKTLQGKDAVVCHLLKAKRAVRANTHGSNDHRYEQLRGGIFRSGSFKAADKLL